MLEKVGHIKNPLTVIAIFAAIAEISGTGILPFIEPENQKVYVWFLMLFPVFLVGVFFLTLNFNHKVLYAPSDYKDEKYFVDLSVKASPEEQGQRLQQEVKEIELEEKSAKEKNNQLETHGNTEPQRIFVRDSDEGNLYKSNVSTSRDKNRELMADLTLAQKLAINKLSKELHIPFKTDVRFEFSRYGRSIIFDAVGVGDRHVHAVTVKLFKVTKVDLSRLRVALEDAEISSKQFNGIDPKDFVLHIFAVLDSPQVEIGLLKHSLNEYVAQFDVNARIHITTLSDLQHEYEYNP